MKNLLLKKLSLNNERVISKEIDGEIVFFDIQEKKLYELNETASFICASIDRKNNVKEIIKEMTAQYDIEEKTAEKDLLEFVKEGIKKNFFTLTT